MTEEDMFDHMDKLLGETSDGSVLGMERVHGFEGSSPLPISNSKPREHPYWEMHDVWGYKVVLYSEGLKLWECEP